MPIRVEDIRKDLRDRLERIWRERRFRMTFAEFLALFVWGYNRAEEVGIPDPETFILEQLDYLDPSLTYYENQAILETKIIGYYPTPPEIEELEYYKKRVEELERKLKELERVVKPEEIEKLRREVEEWKKRYEQAKKTIEELKRTPGLTEEDVSRIVRENLKDFGRALGEGLKAIAVRVRELERATTEITKRIESIEKRIAEMPPVTVERAEVVAPEIPPREPTFVRRIDMVTKEEYETDADFEYRVSILASLVGASISRIFFETSDETRKKLGYPTWLDLAKGLYKSGVERGLITPVHLRIIGFTDDEIRRIMN